MAPTCTRRRPPPCSRPACTVASSAWTVAVAMSGLFVFGVAAHLVRHRRPGRRPPVDGRGRHAPARDARRRGRTGSGRARRWPTSTVASTGSPAGCSRDPWWSAAWHRSSSCSSALRSSAPASRTATPARCRGRRRCGPPPSRSPDASPARGPDPVTVIAYVDASDPTVATWLATVAGDPEVLGTSIRPNTPVGLTIVDLVPSGTSQGDAATAPSPPAAAAQRCHTRRHPGRWAGGRTDRCEGATRSPPAVRSGPCAWPRCSCSS